MQKTGDCWKKLKICKAHVEVRGNRGTGGVGGRSAISQKEGREHGFKGEVSGLADRDMWASS